MIEEFLLSQLKKINKPTTSVQLKNKNWTEIHKVNERVLIILKIHTSFFLELEIIENISRIGQPSTS